MMINISQGVSHQDSKNPSVRWDTGIVISRVGGRPLDFSVQIDSSKIFGLWGSGITKLYISDDTKKLVHYDSEVGWIVPPDTRQVKSITSKLVRRYTER